MKQAIECMLNPPMKGSYKVSFIDGWQTVRAGEVSILRYHGRNILVQMGKLFKFADDLSAEDRVLAQAALDVIGGVE